MLKRTVRTVQSDVAWYALGVGVVMVVAIWRLTAGRGHTLETLSPTVALVTYALVLGAAASVYAHWRLSSIDGDDGWNRRLSGWLVVGLTVAALPGFLVAFMQQTPRDGTAPGVDGWLLVSQVVVAVLLVMITHVSERIDVVRDPALVGVVGGLVLTAATCLAMATWPAFRLGPDSAAVVGTTLMLVGLVLAWNLLQRTRVSLWVRERLAFSAVTLVLAQCAGHLDGPVAAGAAVVTNSLGALVLCATALRLLNQAMQEHQEQVLQLHSTLHEAEDAVLAQRELLHELGSTLAGISSASEILRQGPPLPAPRRHRLEQLLEAEVARLVRLMSDRRIPESRQIDVDEVLEPIVLSHQTRGADVRWNPSGHTAVGQADDLAEVVNILLENASRHGSGPVTLTTSTSGGAVEIVCSDRGPGVPNAIHEQIFESGVHRTDSPGQGLGLAIAQRLVTEQGGSLDLRDDAPGATFVVRLPERIVEGDLAHDIAHAS